MLSNYYLSGVFISYAKPTKFYDSKNVYNNKQNGKSNLEIDVNQEAIPEDSQLRISRNYGYQWAL